MDTHAVIGKRMQGVLNEAACTQKNFATVEGYSQGYISDVCRGKKGPSLRLIDSFLNRFGVSASWLLAGRGEARVDTGSAPSTTAPKAMRDAHPALRDDALFAALGPAGLAIRASVYVGRFDEACLEIETARSYIDALTVRVRRQSAHRAYLRAQRTP